MPTVFATNQSVMEDYACTKCSYPWAKAELENRLIIYTCIQCGKTTYEDLPKTPGRFSFGAKEDSIYHGMGDQASQSDYGRTGPQWLHVLHSAQRRIG